MAPYRSANDKEHRAVRRGEHSQTPTTLFSCLMDLDPFTTQISSLYASEREFADDLVVRKWLSNQSFEEQAKFGRQVIEDFEKAVK
jgi:hypothetical protein